MWRSFMRAPLAAAFALLIAVPAMAGQQELLDAWASKKQAVTEKVYERLRQEGKLPRDGSVEFKAHTRPDPDNPGSVLVEVDEVRLSPAADTSQNGGDAASKSEDTVGDDLRVRVTRITPVTLELRNTDSGEFVSYQELDIPTEQSFSGRFEIRKGVIMDERKAQSQWTRAGEKPGEKAPAEP